MRNATSTTYPLKSAQQTSTAEGFISAFKDKFSNHASDYGRYRPIYPQALGDYLASLTNGHTAVDVACGSGQLTKSLGVNFQQVYGFDASPQQIQEATEADNITYSVAQAESLPLADNSADLITIAQALHWFDIDTFWQEAQRIGKSGCVVSAICYGLCNISAELDIVINGFYESLRPYWSAERSLIESAYATIPFPFEELTPPAFIISHEWNLSQFLSYIGTWSAVKACQADNKNHYTDFKNTLQTLVDSAQCLKVNFPVSMRIGRIIK